MIHLILLQKNIEIIANNSFIAPIYCKIKHLLIYLQTVCIFAGYHLITLTHTEKHPESISLTTLFLTFLKVGSTSFGGFMALVSVVEYEMVKRKKQIGSEVILDGISLASVLPGPLAVNVVTYIGFYLRGLKGGLISMMAIILPSFLLVYGLSVLYFHYGDLPAFSSVFKGITPAVTAIVLSVAVNMTRKNIKHASQYIILVISAALLLSMGGVMITFLIIAGGGIIGLIVFKQDGKSVKKSDQNVESTQIVKMKSSLRGIIILVLIMVATSAVIILVPAIMPTTIGKNANIYGDIIVTFSGMSLSLFGGGYVIIPIIKELIVAQLGWLTDQEFIDGIALGQVTPGPILISAAFIGYKISGFAGALIATIAIFLPPGILMMIGANFLITIKSSPNVKSIFMGLRPAVIGMIFSAVWTLGKTSSLEWGTVITFFVVLLLLFRFKISVVYLIPAAGLLGYLIF